MKCSKIKLIGERYYIDIKENIPKTTQGNKPSQKKASYDFLNLKNIDLKS